MQTVGITKFDYRDYKLHADWKLDDDIRDFVTNALKSRLSVKNDISPQVFSGIKSSFTETLWDNIGTHIRLMSPAPDVDAIVVIYPNVTDPTGFISHDLAVTHQPGFLWHDPTVMVAASYAVGIFDPKSGERLNYGTGRWPDRRYISGYSPPWEVCPNSMWSELGR